MNPDSRSIFGRMPVTSTRQLLAWGDHFKVDQPQIDAQHEAIFSIATEIADSWHNRGAIDNLKVLTDKLANVLAAHFRYEERQLADVGYPKLAQHKAEHEVMLEELRVIQERLGKTAPDADRMGPGFVVHNFVLGLTVGHISHSDMDYCAFAREAAEREGKGWQAAG
jgi:hemerythrin